jgi:hypothetical protein
MASHPLSALEMPALTAGTLERTMQPGALARLEARLRAGALDQAIAAGADPASSPAMARRAASLTSPRTRLRLAAALAELVAVADGRRTLLRVRPARAAVARQRDLLLELAATLCGPEPVYARGVALLFVLVRDGTGPAYVAGSGDELARHLRAARAALAG